MKITALLWTLCISSWSWANFAQYFGAATLSSSLGNQASFELDDPAHNFYAPAWLAFNDSLSLSLSSQYTTIDVSPIEGIVVDNSLTKGGGESSGSAATNYEDLYMSSVHLNLPLLGRDFLKWGISLVTPTTEVAEFNTGHPYRPEYVMYRARQRRTLFITNLAYPLTPSWGVSLGLHGGLKTSSYTDSNQALNATTPDSSASMKTEVSPVARAIVSVAYRSRAFRSALTYVQKLESSLRIDLSGQTDNPPTLFNNTMTSQLAFDPAILRWSNAFDYSEEWRLLGSLEFQRWSDYQTPVIRISNNGGILKGSGDYEQISADNIWVPSLGVRFRPSSYAFHLGAQYHPTPLSGSFAGAGNSVDTDRTVVSAGIEKSFRWEPLTLHLRLGAQYHALKKRWVAKSSGREDGDSSENKVGYPGYEIGGHLQMYSLGVDIAY